jgi:uncharacterized membrane protein
MKRKSNLMKYVFSVLFISMIVSAVFFFYVFKKNRARADFLETEYTGEIEKVKNDFAHKQEELVKRINLLEKAAESIEPGSNTNAEDINELINRLDALKVSRKKVIKELTLKHNAIMEAEMRKGITLMASVVITLIVITVIVIVFATLLSGSQTCWDFEYRGHKIKITSTMKESCLIVDGIVQDKIFSSAHMCTGRLFGRIDEQQDNIDNISNIDNICNMGNIKVSISHGIYRKCCVFIDNRLVYPEPGQDS